MSIIRNKFLRELLRKLLPVSLRRKLANRYFAFQEWREYRRHHREMNSPDVTTTLQDGFLRLYMTFKCNARCVFCDHYLLKRNDADPKLLYDYLLPLYERLKYVSLVGGEVTILPESLKYCRFLQENYPQITIGMESNGILFDETWQQLAADCLFRTHFSMNAPDEESFARHVWQGEKGIEAYRKARRNLEAHIALLKERGMLPFAPSISMVVSREHSTRELYDFLKFSLENHAAKCTYYFNHLESGTSNKMAEEFEVDREKLRLLMELERLLTGKVIVDFRLLMPPEFETMQPEVDALPIVELQKKYADIWTLATERDIMREYELRTQARKAAGKKLLTLDEDVFMTLRSTEISGKKVCFAPWLGLDISTNGRIDLCGWLPTPNRLNVYDFIRNGTVDWDAVLNHPRFKIIRYRMLKNDYRYCMPNCKMNPARHSIPPTV